MRTDWEHFSLLENGLTLSPYNFITIGIATGVCEMCIRDSMVHFVEDSSLNAGFSRCMNGHMNLRRQYIQAKIALQFGTRKYPDKRMHPFNDISFDYILDQATKKLPGYMLCRCV